MTRAGARSEAGLTSAKGQQAAPSVAQHAVGGSLSRTLRRSATALVDRSGTRPRCARCNVGAVPINEMTIGLLSLLRAWSGDLVAGGAAA